MMSKSETSVLKGVAILFMLYLHLFNQPANVALCKIYLSIGGEPLVSILARCANPVAFFIILSGYGLYISHSNGHNGNFKRIVRLYVHYWIALLIFVTIGYFVRGGEIYPGSWGKILENVTAWNTTYNGEMWFLFPYMMVALASKWVFSVINRLKWWKVLVATGLLYLITNIVISRYGDNYIYSHRLFYMPLQYINFLFSFCIGAMMAKYNIVNKCKKTEGLPLLFILVAVNAYINKGIAYPLYSAAFIVLFAKIRRPSWLDTALNELGKRSTSMWFVHSYFCYYLFKDFIYGLRFPIVIFAVLLTLCYLTAIAIDWLNGLAQKNLLLHPNKSH